MYVLPTVASTDRSLNHGPSCKTLNGIRNSQKFQPRKIGQVFEDGRTYGP